MNKKPKQGFISAAVRKFYYDLRYALWDDNDYTKAVSLANRCLKDFENGTENVETPKNRFRKEGGGRKKQASNIITILELITIGNIFVKKVLN